MAEIISKLLQPLHQFHDVWVWMWARIITLAATVGKIFRCCVFQSVTWRTHSDINTNIHLQLGENRRMHAHAYIHWADTVNSGGAGLQLKLFTCGTQVKSLWHKRLAVTEPTLLKSWTRWSSCSIMCTAYTVTHSIYQKERVKHSLGSALWVGNKN